MPLAPSLSPRPSAVASAAPSRVVGVATPVVWCRVGAFPELATVYDWRDDLWWPDTAAGELLAALARADSRALTRL